MVLFQTAYFTEQDIQDVERQCKSADNFVGVDILLTPDWPKDVCANTVPPVSCCSCCCVCVCVCGYYQHIHFIYIYLTTSESDGVIEADL